MAHYAEASWPITWDASTKRGRRGGRYRAYVPDKLSGRNLELEPDVAHRISDLESKLRHLGEQEHAHSLDGLARFLLRSEAIASSRIEGLQAAPQKIALAELAIGGDEPVRGFSETARLVANNITVLRSAVTTLAQATTVSIEDITRLQESLLPDNRHHGLRTVQNWIGGGDTSPLDAEFIPPPADHVVPLMEDLAAYLNSAVHVPLVQAALVHAQFETIHPFSDGNGRIGRALIHTVLARRALTRTAVLPISLALRTRSDEYIDGLTAYRYPDPDANSPGAIEGVNRWLRVFFDATDIAIQQAESLMSDLEHLLTEWDHRLQQYRDEQGKRRVRQDSAAARMLRILPEAPILTARSTQRLLEVTHPAARAALEELTAAGILRAKQVDRKTTGYQAVEVFELLTYAERNLASTQWNTRLSPPSRPAPARPQQRRDA